jgi:hypothetical protein
MRKPRNLLSYGGLFGCGGGVWRPGHTADDGRKGAMRAEQVDLTTSGAQNWPLVPPSRRSSGETARLTV